mmetsp:Transcript_130579/g.279197  ORF Transcript_130579/g.279197 Transcript_130579/m.279197 type:complete len:318 (+) Transcript_130579:63-1016(+)
MEADLDHTLLTEDTKPMLIGTMNSQFKEALKVCAQHFCDTDDVALAQIVEIDQSKFLLRYWDAGNGLHERNIDYQTATGDVGTASSAGDVRRLLVDMARTASEALGKELALPCGASIGSRESDKLPGAYLLNDLVDVTTLECLNQDDAHPVTNAVSRYAADAERLAGAALQSDPGVDHQLLIKIGFRQPVKLKAITFRGTTEDDTAPRVVKVFQGQKDIDFQDADEAEPLHLLNITESQIQACDPLVLHFVKFQHVSTLQLFVESNFGADITRIERLEFWGTPAETVDMKVWKPVRQDVNDPLNPIYDPPQADHTGA